MIGPLTDPAAHGGEPADAFHLVIPSLPGYGFSGPLTETGWTDGRTAAALAELMTGSAMTATACRAGTWVPSSPR